MHISSIYFFQDFISFENSPTYVTLFSDNHLQGSKHPKTDTQEHSEHSENMLEITP